MAAPIYIEFLISDIITNILYFLFFFLNNSHLDEYDVVSFCDIDSHFPYVREILLGICISLPLRNVYSTFCPFKHSCCCLEHLFKNWSLRKFPGGAVVKNLPANTCKPMAFSFQCMTKSTTKKKKNLPASAGNRGSVPGIGRSHIQQLNRKDPAGHK